MQQQGHYLRSIAIIYILVEIVLLNILFFVMLYVFDIAFDEVFQIAFCQINLGYLFAFAVIPVNFNDVRQLHRPKLLRRNFYKLAITALIIITSLFFIKGSEAIPRRFIFVYFTTAYLSMTFAQWATRKALTFTIMKTINTGIILGAGVLGKKLFDEITLNVYNGIIIFGFFDDHPDPKNTQVLGDIEQAKNFILRNGVTNVFCTLPPSSEEKILDFIKFAESHMIRFHIVPAIGYYYSGAQPIVEHIGQMPVFILRHIPLSYVHLAFIKRSIDILLSLVAIVTLFPILFPVLSILIKLSSPGPIIFKQLRTGKQGKIFNCYKFRTMRSSFDANIKQATADDDRKTKIGNFLRRTSLDELPQLYNVLIGNMSFVGPRPHMLIQTYEYTPKVDKYMVRHFIKPGITGLAQVKGYRGETKEVELMEKRIMEDIYYVENWTLKLDLKIMIKTVLMILTGDEKAY